MVTSENQVRHLYVVESLPTVNAGKHLAASAGAGAIAVQTDAAKKNLFFEYVNALGNLERTDLINVDKIMWLNTLTAGKMERKTTVKQIVPASVTSGCDYYIRATFRQYVGMSDADTYAKYGSAHATSTSTVATVLADLAVSMAKSLAPEASELLKVYLLVTAGTKTGAVEVTKTSKLSDLTGSYVGIALEEVEQPWVKGIMESVPVYFELGGNEAGQDTSGANTYGEWGVVTDITTAAGTTIGNGKKVADLEYFLLGERGDQYRAIDPFGIHTEGLADAAHTYDILTIHYYTDECGTNNARSEKDLSLAIDKSGSATLSAVIAKISAASANIGKVPYTADGTAAEFPAA